MKENVGPGNVKFDREMKENVGPGNVKFDR